MKNRKLGKNAVLILIVVFAFLVRIYRISQVPPSLYWDEVALGYDAYSILKTGRDQHGNIPITYLTSFGDYKNPLYVYLSIPFIKMLGLNSFSVRLLSVICGTLIVFLGYFLARELFKVDNKKNYFLGLVTSFVLAVNPFLIHLSRVAFEANLYLCVLTAGIVLYIFSLKKPFFLILTAVLFGLLPYSYHSGKMLFPFIILLIAVISWKEKAFFLKKDKMIYLFFSFLILSVFIIPFFSSRAIENTFFRFQGVSDIYQKSKELPEFKTIYQGLLERIFLNRRFAFIKTFLEKYLSHFGFSFLFIKGDENLRHSVLSAGLFYLIESFLCVIGFWSLINKRRKWLVLGLLVLAPLPSAVAVKSPHALRACLMVVPLALIIAFGVFYFYKKLNKKLFYFLFISIYLFSFINFYYFYQKYYSQQTAVFWQDGYRQLITALDKYDDSQRIFIDNKYGQAYLYTLFYKRFDPSRFQKEGKVIFGPHGYFWETTAVFDKYQFGNVFKATPSAQPKDIFILAGTEKIPQFKTLEQIENVQGKTVFSIMTLANEKD